MNSHYLDFVTFFEMIFVFIVGQQYNLISVFMKSDVNLGSRKHNNIFRLAQSLHAVPFVQYSYYYPGGSNLVTEKRSCASFPYSLNVFPFSVFAALLTIGQFDP